MTLGYFNLVLHNHIPYCRYAGVWPHGEEWLHEAMLESYLPLLDILFEMREQGVKYEFTIGFTPVLLDQLADTDIQQNFIKYCEAKLERVRKDVELNEKTGDVKRKEIAKFYFGVYQQSLNSFHNRHNKNIIKSLKLLQDEGYIEVITSAATHSYLPLLATDSSIYAQIKVGIDTYIKHFGMPPRSFWLPECGYRSAYKVGETGRDVIRHGLESFLSSMNIRCFFVETNMIESSLSTGISSAELVNPAKRASFKNPRESYEQRKVSKGTTYSAYLVGDSNVASLARNADTSLQVWSADWGYPGDYDYREFHKKDSTSGLQYWRITGPRLDLAHKDLYNPIWAQNKVEEHSRHFNSLVLRLLSSYQESSGKPGIIVSAYDGELFGHWWFEGVQWLRSVLTSFSKESAVEMTGSGRYVADHPPAERIDLRWGSWGKGGDSSTWLNPDTEDLWNRIHLCERRMEDAVARYPLATGLRRSVLNQSARELLLLQSSDWPFLITTGQAREYAISRFQAHYEHFNKLIDIAENGAEGTEESAFLKSLEEKDNPFSSIDYKVFARREPGLFR